jgi:hypothetical protein
MIGDATAVIDQGSVDLTVQLGCCWSVLASAEAPVEGEPFRVWCRFLLSWKDGVMPKKIDPQLRELRGSCSSTAVSTPRTRGLSRPWLARKVWERSRCVDE